jgi:hypothetical protein
LAASSEFVIPGTVPDASFCRQKVFVSAIVKSCDIHAMVQSSFNVKKCRQFCQIPTIAGMPEFSSHKSPQFSNDGGANFQGRPGAAAADRVNKRESFFSSASESFSSPQNPRECSKS